jgi:hypothetical protein
LTNLEARGPNKHINKNKKIKINWQLQMQINNVMLRVQQSEIRK